MSFELPLDHGPTHRLPNLLVVVGDLNPGDGILEILILIAPESPMD